LLNTVEELVNGLMKQETKSLATREDVFLLKEDILQVENRLNSKINDQFKWLIGVFITLALMIIGLYFKR
jgi:hypothetical protein